MSHEQKPHKWQKEIVAWAGGAKIERRRLSGGYGLQWELFDEYANPAWNSPDYEFRIYDKHREVKEAMARGELCQWSCGNGWVDALEKPTAYNFGDGCEWRIAPKPDPYQHLRDAIRAGKQIEFYSNDIDIGFGRSSWVSLGTANNCRPDRTFHLPPDHYRIAPKPDSSVNGAICYVHNNLNRFFKVTAIIDGETGEIKSVELMR